MDEKVLREILTLATRYKAERKSISWRPLAGQTWALIFSKASTRTRVSFEVGIRELGGHPLFLNANDLQLGRGEPIKDTARVLGRMAQGAIIRTFAHPCQILADIQTVEEKLGPVKGKRIAFIGDCACNVARSWIYAAEIFQFQLALAAPEGYQSGITNSFVTQTKDVRQAARGADVLYTDVWVSMGLESEKAERAKAFAGYQINRELVGVAKKNVLVQHCLPAYRDQEISAEIFEQHATDIFDQAENRLHAQKGLLHWLTEKPLE